MHSFRLLDCPLFHFRMATKVRWIFYYANGVGAWDYRYFNSSSSLLEYVQVARGGCRFGVFHCSSVDAFWIDRCLIFQFFSIELFNKQYIERISNFYDTLYFFPLSYWNWKVFFYSVFLRISSFCSFFEWNFIAYQVEKKRRT